MSKYFIQLRPLDYFFFGGARTFGADNAHYYVRSRHFPQQTALVGLLRHLMLQGGLKKNEIGDSFDASGTSVQSFGPLQGLSPLFLYQTSDKDTQGRINPDGVFFAHPLDAHQAATPYAAKATQNAWKLDLAGKGNWEKAAAVLEGYDPKMPGISDKELRLINGKGDCYPKGKTHVFTSTTRVGITKRHRNRQAANAQEKERGFYKQQVFKLEKQWAFGFLADFDETYNAAALDGTVMPFGGERSLFRISVQPTTDSWQHIENGLTQAPFNAATTGVKRIILLSDTFADPTIYQNTLGAVTDTIDFQHLHTPATTRNFAALTYDGKKNPDLIRKSAQFTLLARGSVLYATDSQTAGITQQLMKEAPFRGIGYNYFIIR